MFQEGRTAWVRFLRVYDIKEGLGFIRAYKSDYLLILVTSACVPRKFHP